ncbi:MAG: hypothetical protein E7021_02925 [Alphaproteobacteria bacterium]|nr:hypothetical protein [Alphaproteobacteria bacterium]
MIKKTNIAKVFSLTVFCGMLTYVNPVLSQELDSTQENTATEVEADSETEIDLQSQTVVQTEISEPNSVEDNHEEISLDSQTSESETNTDEGNDISETTEQNDLLPADNEIPSQSDETILNYTWADFVTQKDCREFISNLNKNSDFKDLTQLLKPYCNTNEMSAWDKWLYTFRQEKKELLVSQTLMEKSPIKYIKVIPYFFFDIQNTNSSGSTPKDILNQIQQAIIDHQIQNAMTLTLKLPENWQQKLKKTTDFGETIIKIKDGLNELNAEQGVQND